MMEQWNFWFGTRDGQLDVYEGEKEYISNGMDGVFTLKELLRVRYVYEICEVRSVFSEEDNQRISELLDEDSDGDVDSDGDADSDGDVDSEKNLNKIVEELEGIVDVYNANQKKKIREKLKKNQEENLQGKLNKLFKEVKLSLFDSFERDKRDVIDNIFNWIMGVGNYSKTKQKKQKKQHCLRMKEFYFINYLIDIYESKGFEYKILKNGKKTKTIAGEVYCKVYPFQYKMFLSGIWEGIQGFNDSQYIEMDIEKIKEYWREHYGVDVEDWDCFMKSQDLEDKLEMQKMTILKRIEKLMSLIETDPNSVERFCNEFDAFLDRTEENDIMKEFTKLKEQMARELFNKEDLSKKY